MAQLHVQAEAGIGGEGAGTGVTGECCLTQVYAAMSVQLRRHAEGFTTVWAAMAPHL